jgi:hypothetical protein
MKSGREMDVDEECGSRNGSQVEVEAEVELEVESEKKFPPFKSSSIRTVGRRQRDR